ncbi:MAG: argininosuccinate synthase [Tannerellaceae bacterium]|jgi:argininosuccinate synthase|nr:argininosuccinate synthase [Tannerellaceae bacterium]
MRKKVVLAFSGGLDTSFCLMYLTKEKNYEVHTVLADTGGFSEGERRIIEQRAYDLGAASHTTLNVAEDYYEKSIKYMIYGNVLRNGTYPISVSSERIFQAMAVVDQAIKIEADALAHGSTGAGNDQVRFDLTFEVLAPGLEIITPTRDLNLSREFEIRYLKDNGYTANFKKMAYSINKGLWGTSIGGRETLQSDQNLPNEAFPSQLNNAQALSQDLSIYFLKGEVAGVNGVPYHDKVEAIGVIEEIGAKWAVGRDMHVGDTIIGIKGRVGFEAAAALLIINAHKLLEKHTLTKWQMYWKGQIAEWYGMFLHEAQYLDPVMRDMEAFLESSQQNVTGKVMIQLRPYDFKLIGIQSENDLMKSDFGVYGEEQKAWSAEDVKGFTKILSNHLKVYHNVHKRKK